MAACPPREPRNERRMNIIFLARHAVRLTMRDLRRTTAIGIGIVLASALVTAVLLFGTASGSTVTRRALAGEAVDAQVVLQPGADQAAAVAIVTGDPAVQAALPFELVAFDTAELQRAGTATQTTVGALVGVDAGYVDSTGLFTVAQGTREIGQVTISRDLATNLGAVPGDTLRFTLPGGATVDLVISGIADTTGADLILGPVDAAHRAAGANPPANVAVIDLTSLDAIAALIPPDAVPAPPPGNQTTPGSPVAAATPAVRREIHLRYDHAQLPGEPVAAQAWLDGVRRRIELPGGGAFSVVDDAAASLEPIAADLLWGQILFIFLALPGVVLALTISRFAADATAEATRQHIALLRARGATIRQVAGILLGSTAAVALVASLVGAFAGAAVAWLRFGGDLANGDPVGSTLRAIVLAVLLTTVLATVAAAWPLREQLRAELALGRQEVQRSRAPLWQRLYLDVLAIIGAVAVFVLTGGTGLHPVFNAEGNPTVTLALASFVAPLLLWLGVTLLLLRLAGALLNRGGAVIAGLRTALGPGGELAGRSLQSRAPAASRTVVLLALTVSFATALLVFDATYRQQQRIDAELTLGADLKVTPTGTTPTSATVAAVVNGPGVVVATPFVDRIVYVGSEAQDLLAIDPQTLPLASPLADTFFGGTTATGAMSALGSQPDAILVSSETAHDYSIVPGDKLMIRVPDAHGVLMTVTFHMVGIALEFPTAPKDAFLVANLSYVAAQTGNDSISYVLARASGDPPTAALQVAARLGQGWQVSDLETTNARLANGITSVDLAGLVFIEVLFAVLIAALGSAFFLLAEMSIRRRELATIEAIGGEPRQLQAAVAGEVLVMGIAGVIGGLIVGGLIGLMLLQILAGLFDPPADFPALPMAQIGALVVGIAAGLAGAVIVAGFALARLPILASLRER
jgi:putative ABC transport system permease protein